MATLKEAIEYSRQNPKSDFARLLKQRIQSGEADQDFAREGIDPTPFGRTPVAVVAEETEVTPEAAPEEKPFTEKIAGIWGSAADKVGAAQNRGAQGGQSMLETGFQTLTEGLGAVSDTAVETLKATPVIGEGIKKTEDAIGGATQAVVENVPGAREALTKASEIWEGLDERTKANLGGIGEVANWVTGGFAGKAAKKGGEIAIEKGLEAAKKGGTVAKEAATTGVEAVSKAGTKVAETRPVKVVVNKISDSLDEMSIRRELKKRGQNAVNIYDETGSPEFVNLVDNTKSVEDLSAKAKMLDVAEQRMAGTASSKMPRQVVADDYVVPRVDALRSRLEDLGKTIGNYGGSTKTFGTAKGKQRVDTTDIFNKMVQEAKRFDVRVGKDDTGKLVFSAAPGVSGVDTARLTAVKELFAGFQPDKTGKTTNTIEQLAKTRKNLSALTKRTDAAKEIVGPGGAVDNIRRLVAQKIGPEYFQATKEYSDIARVLEQLDIDQKVRLSDDALEEVRNIKFSDYARRLLSNNAAQAKSVFKSLDELYAKEAARKGIKVPEQDLEDLVDFAGAVEEGFGITPRNTFFGQAKGANDASFGAGFAIDAATGLPVATAMNVVKNVIKKPSKNPKRTLQAMKAYVKEVQSKR